MSMLKIGWCTMNVLPRSYKWGDAVKLKNVYLSLNEGASAWCENRADALTSWEEFKHRLIEMYASPDRRKRAERDLQSRIQMPNEGVAMYVEDMTCLFRRADPGMSEEKKVRYLMRGVKEQPLLPKLCQNFFPRPSA